MRTETVQIHQAVGTNRGATSSLWNEEQDRCSLKTKKNKTDAVGDWPVQASILRNLHTWPSSMARAPPIMQSCYGGIGRRRRTSCSYGWYYAAAAGLDIVLHIGTPPGPSLCPLCDQAFTISPYHGSVPFCEISVVKNSQGTRLARLHPQHRWQPLKLVV
jgi:hypothetical protein